MTRTVEVDDSLGVGDAQQYQSFLNECWELKSDQVGWVETQSRDYLKDGGGEDS